MNAAVPPALPHGPSERQSVLTLLAMAEAWHQRAAVLRLLSFEVGELFAGEHAKWSVKGLAGGVSPASEAQVATISSELADAAELARAEAEKILAVVVHVAGASSVPALAGTGSVVATAAAMEVPDLDDAVVLKKPATPGPGRRPYPPVVIKSP
jgi:hypothetical protein